MVYNLLFPYNVLSSMMTYCYICPNTHTPTPLLFSDLLTYYTIVPNKYFLCCLKKDNHRRCKVNKFFGFVFLQVCKSRSIR